MKTINGLMKAFTLVFLCNFYLTGVLPYPWLVIVYYVTINIINQHFQGEAANSL